MSAPAPACMGAYLWDFAWSLKQWPQLVIQSKLAMEDGARQGTFLAHWTEGELEATEPSIGRTDRFTTLIFGSARLRPELAGQADLAGYTAQQLQGGKHIRAVLNEIEGEFILAAWDKDQRTLYLAIDPMGHRALYWHPGQGGILWASHPAQLTGSQGKPELDIEGLNLYFALKGIPAPYSLIKGIAKLEPGHYLQASAESGVRQVEYWPLAERASSLYPGDLPAAQAEMRSRAAATIERYMDGATSPVGILLDGSLETSYILAQTVRLGCELRAFSAGYQPRQRGDETSFARQASAELGVPFQAAKCTGKDILSLLQDCLPGLPEPVADATLLPQAFLARQAADQVQVMLDGTGADGVFGGSNKYLAGKYARQYLRLPAFLRQQVIRPLAESLPASRRWRLTDWIRKGQFFIAGCELPEDERDSFWTSFLPRPAVAQALQPAWLAGQDTGMSILHQRRQEFSRPGVSASSYSTLKCIMPWVELARLAGVQQNTGLSVRKPFLSPGMVEFGLSLPDEYKVQGGQGMLVLRQASQGLTPQSVLRRAKANFSPPVTAWLMKDLREIFWDTMSISKGIYNQQTVQRMYQENASGWRDWRSELWAMFVLQYWAINNGLL